MSKWYLRNSNASTGPTGKASTDTDDFPSVPSDKNTAKDMTPAKGSAQVSVTGNYNNAGVAKKTFCRIFVGPALAAQTLTGGQANYKVGVAIKESNGLMNLVHRVFVYVWRSGSGNVKTIIIPTEHIEHTTAELGCLVTATGAATDFSILDNDRIVVEIWWNLNNTRSAAYDATDYYEGATDVIDATATSDAAGFFECPQTLNLAPATYYKSATITESGLVTPSKKQSRKIALAEASSVMVTKKQQRLASILETVSVTAQFKRLYVITALIVSSTILSVLKKQARSVAVQESSTLQVLKAQQRRVTITEASMTTTVKTQQRLTQITNTNQITFSYLRSLKLAFSVTTAPTIAVVKKQTRAFTVAASSVVSFTKQVFGGGGQVYHLAFDITAAAIMAVGKKQFRNALITAATNLAIQKIQRRLTSLATSAVVSVRKVHKLQAYIAASNLIAYALNLISLVLDGREAVRAAFAAILTAANLGVPIYTRMPYQSAEPRSVVITIVSGASRRGALGLIHAAFHGLEEPYRLRADCYHDDQLECEKLADKVEQAIVESASILASTHDIHNVSKVVDLETTPPDAMLRQSWIILEFDFYTHRVVV